MADEKKAAAKAPAAIVQVRMLQSMAGVRIALAPGDVHTCSADEAERLKARGYAADVEA